MNKRQRKQARVRVIIKHDYKRIMQEKAIKEDIKTFYRPLTMGRA